MVNADRSEETVIWSALEGLRGLVSPVEALAHVLGVLGLKAIMNARGALPVLGGREFLPADVSFARLTSSSDIRSTIDGVIELIMRAPTGGQAVAESLGALLAAREAPERVLGRLVTPLAAARADRESVAAVYSLLERADGAMSPPRSVRRLMTRLAGLAMGSKANDPFCGHGALLVEAAANDAQVVEGSHPNALAVSFARIALAIVGARSDVTVGNTLVAPSATHRGPYDAVISAPPFGARAPDQLDIAEGERFRFGVPMRSSEWLYAQHALSVLGEDGRAVLLFPRGALFRGGTEAMVRRGLLEADLIEAVVALPPGLLLPGTAIPSALIVLHRDRPAAYRGTVVFVDVRATEQAGGRRREIPETAIDAVAAAVSRSQTSVAGVKALTVSLAELREADYSLEPGRWFPREDGRATREPLVIVSELREAHAAEALATANMGRALKALVRVTGGGA